MTTRYQITLDSPLGRRSGILMLQGDAGRVNGTLSLLGTENPVQGKREGTALYLHHSLRTRVSRLDCETMLRIEDGMVEGTARVGPARIPVWGRELPDDLKERKKAQV